MVSKTASPFQGADYQVNHVKLHGSGQISSRPHTADFPLKGSVLVREISGYFRELQVGEILFHLARWVYIGDDKLPSYIGIIISHYKDPYQPTRIQWIVFIAARNISKIQPSLASWVWFASWR